MSHKCQFTNAGDGQPCDNVVADGSDHCAAGHPVATTAPGAADQGLGANADPGAPFDMEALLGGEIGTDDLDLAGLSLAVDEAFASSHPGFHPEAAGSAHEIAEHLALAAEFPAERASLREAVRTSDLTTGQIIGAIQACGEPPEWWPVLTELAQRHPEEGDGGLKELITEATSAGVPPRPIATTIAARVNCHPAYIRHFATESGLSTEDMAELAAAGGDRVNRDATLGYTVGLIIAGHDPEKSAYAVTKEMLKKAPELAQDEEWRSVHWQVAHTMGEHLGSFDLAQKILSGVGKAFEEQGI
jgi:hypothetical protein